jgi:hypothetical protein
MKNRALARIRVSTIYRCMQLLSRPDRIKLILVGLIQISLSILDLIGVMLLGVIEFKRSYGWCTLKDCHFKPQLES